jgi:hypothetical protein
LKDAESGSTVTAGHQHGHLVAGNGAKACIAEAEIGGNGVDDHPFAIEGYAPEMEEDRDLDELNHGRGEFPYPVGQEAKHQPSLCKDVHTHE